MQAADRHAWFNARTFPGSTTDPAAVTEAKSATGQTISVCIPALDEESTIGPICAAIREDLMTTSPLVDELVVVDPGSKDRTRAVAEGAGARVVDALELVAEVPTGVGGKGDTLWRSLVAVSGDLIVWLDGDLEDFRSSAVTSLVAPLLEHLDVDLVKGFYGGSTGSRGMGRVTELMARPLINRFYPGLGQLVHPLSGECAGRRRVLMDLPFFTGYGVEIGLLIDVLAARGLFSIAQVDLGTKRHRQRDLVALGEAAQQILSVVAVRQGLSAGPLSMVQFHLDEGLIVPTDVVVETQERPPMVTILERGA